MKSNRFQYLEDGLDNGTIEERFNKVIGEFAYYDIENDEWLDNSGNVMSDVDGDYYIDTDMIAHDND